jgi:hypothetical protein
MLPAQARMDCGYETAATQKPATSARLNAVNGLPRFIWWFLSMSLIRAAKEMHNYPSREAERID